MTENESVLITLQNAIECATDDITKEDLEMMVKCLEELQQYRAIGTVEEFKSLKEKNEPKKVAYQGEHEKCPTCGSFHVFGNYCTECGQRLNWGNE